MAVYSYRARDFNGLLIVGQMDGEAPDTVKETLSDQGLIPLHVLEGGGRFSKDFSMNIFKRVNPEELMLFTRQFNTLFKAGMDMQTLLNTLAAQTRNTRFAETIHRIKMDIAAGASLSRAFAQHPTIFGDLYTNMLAAGEEAGILDQVLGQIATLLEKEVTLKASIKSATLYPKIVVFVLIMASIVLMTFVIPKFASFYSHYDAELPLPTRIMMTTSSLVRGYWYIAGGICLAGGFLFKKWRQTVHGRLLFDRIKWKIPVFGDLGKKVANARFANILGALYKAGIPITDGLETTANTIGHQAFTREVMLVRDEVKKGKSISEAMRERLYFSPLLIEATAIGERSGALDEMYFSVGSHYDMEVGHMLKNLTTLLEPILLFLVFGMVATFALAVFLPMWNLSRAVLH